MHLIFMYHAEFFLENKAMCAVYPKKGKEVQ